MNFCYSLPFAFAVTPPQYLFFPSLIKLDHTGCHCWRLWTLGEKWAPSIYRGEEFCSLCRSKCVQASVQKNSLTKYVLILKICQLVIHWRVVEVQSIHEDVFLWPFSGIASVSHRHRFPRSSQGNSYMAFHLDCISATTTTDLVRKNALKWIYTFFHCICKLSSTIFHFPPARSSE